MYVYITFEEDGFGGERIAKVFSSLELAQAWVIENVFSGNGYYDNKSRRELQLSANELIQVVEVVDG